VVDPDTRAIHLDPDLGDSGSRRAGVAAGVGMALIGAEPDVAGGWGSLLLIVPGIIIAAGSFAAFVETTSLASSRRHLR